VQQLAHGLHAHTALCHATRRLLFAASASLPSVHVQVALPQDPKILDVLFNIHLLVIEMHLAFQCGETHHLGILGSNHYIAYPAACAQVVYFVIAIAVDAVRRELPS
jgi:hypothetical protein